MSERRRPSLPVWCVHTGLTPAWCHSAACCPQVYPGCSPLCAVACSHVHCSRLSIARCLRDQVFSWSSDRTVNETTVIWWIENKRRCKWRFIRNRSVLSLSSQPNLSLALSLCIWSHPCCQPGLVALWLAGISCPTPMLLAKKEHLKNIKSYTVIFDNTQHITSVSCWVTSCR